MLLPLCFLVPLDYHVRGVGDKILSQLCRETESGVLLSLTLASDERLLRIMRDLGKEARISFPAAFNLRNYLVLFGAEA